MVAVLVDDLVDTGGTLARAAYALMEKGAKSVYACCTHPVLSGKAVEILSEAPIEEMIITNTISTASCATPPARVDGPVALVVPHAGYIYSGQIAADAYRQAAGTPVDTVVILGANHTSGTFRRVSVYDGEGYRTPLGVARVARDLAAALVKEGGGVFDSSLHAREHSVEVQVPFVQHMFPGASIVPVVVGSSDPEPCHRFGRALAALSAGRRMLIVASSDHSHYPERRVAADVDRRTLEAVAGMNLDALAGMEARAATTETRGVSTCACGEGPIRVAIEAARALGALKGTVVSYANSGDTAVGDPERVVGYGSAAFGRGEAGADLSALGDVLVIPFSDVSWTPLFTRAGAVIAESGGILSHSSNVAREYNLPCVVSVAQACQIPDPTIVTGTVIHERC